MRPSPGWITPLGLVCVSALSCVDGAPTGPDGAGSAQLSLQPLLAPAGPGGVAIGGVRVSLERTADGSTAVDTTVVFPADADSVMLDLTVPLGSYVEQFMLTLLALDPDGLEVFVGGPTPLVLRSGAPATIAPLLAYVGPGADAASVRALSADTALFFGESMTVDAEAVDAAGTPIDGTPVLWRSLDDLVAGFPDVSTPVVQAGQQRGLARIVASLYTGPADTVLVRAQPLPTSVAVQSGDAQIGAVGGPLPDPLVARVTAGDGLGVEGVWVRFVVTSGDGQLTADSVRSDASGDAAVGYQLGSAGAHTVEASIAGVVATATFTATAAASGEVYWTNGAGGSWSDGANWSTGSAPDASSTAYVTLDGTYTVTLDADAAVGALVLGGASGTQTLVGSAVALTLGEAALVQPSGVLEMSGGSIAGNGALTNQGASTTLLNVAVSVPVANEGLLRLRGTTTLSGGYTTTASAETRVEALGGAIGTIGFTSGWTNLGTLVMSHGGNGGGQTVTLTVAGTLVNEANATMIVEPGIGGGGRVLSTTLDNRGTLDAQTALTINGADAAHLNSGTFQITGGNVTVTQSGSAPSFTSTGTMTVGATRALTMSGGTWSTGGGTLDGTGLVSLGSVAWDIGGGYTVSSLIVEMSGGSIAGNGALTNQGASTTLLNVSVSVPVANQGMLRLRGTTTLSGGYTTTVFAETRVEALGGATGAIEFTTGWTNLGLLVMSHGGNGGGQPVTLTVAGTLVNEANATLVVEAGIGGGGRVLSTELDNRGTFDAQTAVTIDAIAAVHANSGTFRASGGNVTISQSDGSFVSTGTITVDASRTLSLVGGAWSTGGSIVDGSGTISLDNTSWDIGPGHVITALTYTMTGGVLFGNGTLTNQGPGTTLLDVDVFVPIDNQGLLRLQGATTLGSRYTTTASAETRVEALGAANATVDFTSGWTNLGLLVMSHGGGGGGQSATLTVAGTLVNEAGAEIVAEPGVGGGARVLTTQLDNRGGFHVQTALTINGDGAAHVNSGIFEMIDGDLTIIQTGATPAGAPPSFTSGGVILVGVGRVFAVSGGTFTHTAGGGLEGDGTIDVTGTLFTSEGVIVPGLPTGILTLAGDYIPIQTSVLDIELGGTAAGTEYDRLAVTGDVDLQGTLNVKLINFTPQQGDRFVIMTFGGGGGLFDTVNLPQLPGGLFWNVVYGQNDVTLEVLIG